VTTPWCLVTLCAETHNRFKGDCSWHMPRRTFSQTIARIGGPLLRRQYLGNLLFGATSSGPDGEARTNLFQQKRRLNCLHWLDCSVCCKQRADHERLLFKQGCCRRFGQGVGSGACGDWHPRKQCFSWVSIFPLGTNSLCLQMILATC
jgi:hypothetical protein